MAWASLFRQLSNWLWKPVEWLVEVWQGLCIFLFHALKKARYCSHVGDFTWQLKKIVNSPQNWFWVLSEASVEMLQFFFLLRSPINILCRRTWLILHSSGYMSKPHLDSWVKYTRQRNLWGPEPLTCGMKRSHHRSFLPLLPLLPLPTYFACSLRAAHPWWVVTPRSLTSSPRETECCSVMQPSCGKYGVCDHIDRELPESLRPGQREDVPAKECLVWVLRAPALTSEGSTVAKILVQCRGILRLLS